MAMFTYLGGFVESCYRVQHMMKGMSMQTNTIRGAD